MGRVLGIDYGTARVGLAISDPDGKMAFGRETVPPARVLDAIARMIREDEIERIVVGWPRTLSGKAGPAAAAVDAFIAKLRGELPEMPIERWDERLSTAQSERMLIDSGLSRKKRREVIDQSAAMLILQSWLDAQR